MRKEIRCITDLSIGESAYIFVSQLGRERTNIPGKLVLLSSKWGISPIFNVTFGGFYIILVIKTIHIKPITFIL